MSHIHIKIQTSGQGSKFQIVFEIYLTFAKIEHVGCVVKLNFCLQSQSHPPRHREVCRQHPTLPFLVGYRGLLTLLFEFPASEYFRMFSSKKNFLTLYDLLSLPSVYLFECKRYDQILKKHFTDEINSHFILQLRPVFLF